MKIIEKYTNVFSFFKIKKSVIIAVRNELKNEQDAYALGASEKIKVQSLWHNGDYVYDIHNDKIIVYDYNLNHLYNLNKQGITEGNSSILYIDENLLILYQSIWNNDDTISSYFTYYENLTEKFTYQFCGEILDKNYRLNINEEEKYNNPTYFRLSNILDTNTYFEYQCESNEEIYSEVKLFKEKLFFYTKEKNKESYDSKFWINVLDVEKGNLIHKIEIIHYDACFDEETGRFISIQGTNQNNETIKLYEIADIQTGKVERGDFNYDGEMFAVGTAVQFYNDGKLYFADNVYSYEEQKRQSPKIGRFDVNTKLIDFFETLEEAKGYSVNNLIVSGEKIYAKTNNNILYILQQ